MIDKDRHSNEWGSADRSADNFSEDDRDMRIMVRGGVYEVDLAEWKCHSIYWPGEAFDIMRGTWYDMNLGLYVE